MLWRSWYVAVELLCYSCCVVENYFKGSNEKLLCCWVCAVSLRTAVLLTKRCGGEELLYYWGRALLRRSYCNVKEVLWSWRTTVLCCWRTVVLLRVRCPLGVLLYSIDEELLCCRLSTVLWRKDCAVEDSVPLRSNCGDEGMVFFWGSTVLFCWRITVPMRN